ncbi:GTPase and tRNA-U34 5-formylation enzyme TrmE [Vibrio maritimus]|uniref:GTPase and tRNA-U34 5-formylation enzyme TrmE n=1 Tax=Vibrio maritimus TaxID=990268 RepID=A0A090U3J9_9VIBR|nr:GTPase and tRNA-U34 5-formylation enzyme TrmE [Vibrio maritimus]
MVAFFIDHDYNLAKARRIGNSMTTDTIVAQATAPGRGGVGIIRVSGPLAQEVAQQVTGKTLKPRYADYLPFKDENGGELDQGIALYFPNPHSFTGEDVLELQGHGVLWLWIC